jgi:hypothetical protein
MIFDCIPFFATASERMSWAKAGIIEKAESDMDAALSSFLESTTTGMSLAALDRQIISSV